VSKAYFITFEGGEGVGKSTQIKKLSAFLHTRKINHLVTREPGGSPIAEEIRRILVQGHADKLDPITEYLLFSAARRDHLLNKIFPALQQGQWIICDRFYDSSLVYQGMAQGLDPAFLEYIYEQIAPSFKPDLTFILDCDPEKALRRTSSRAHQEDRFEKKGLAFHQKIRQGFLDIAHRNPDRCIVIKTEQTLEQVTKKIKAAITQRFLGDD
jgi:dTMP kinase